jgi:hypothetical protein
MTGAGASRPSQVSCPQCGALVERGKHALCPECGFPFNWAEQAPPEVDQPSAGMAHTPDETGETTQPHAPPVKAPTAPPPRPPPETVERVPMVTCPVCQTANPRTRTFCQHCGAQLAGPAPPVHPAAGPRRPRPRLPGWPRGWLLVLAAIVLPVAAYVGTTQLLREDPPVGTTPATTAASTTTRPPAAACPSAITEPQPGTPTRLAPLEAIRDYEGWTDPFVVVGKMRSWRAEDGQRQWYVKAYQQGFESRRGRWLVGQEPEAQPRVLASAAFGTRGYKPSDWEVASGQQAPTGIAGCLART